LHVPEQGTPRSSASARTFPASIKGFQGNYRRERGHRAQETRKVYNTDIFEELDKENRPVVANHFHKFENEQF
jgi:hypothetical protein